MNTSSPFRDSSPTDIPDRVAKLEKDVETIQKGWRENVWIGWRRLGKVLATLATLAATILACHFVLTHTILRGSVWGAAARRNSEREALRWGKSQWPTLTPADLYCTPDGMPGPVMEQNCYVTDPSHTTWRIVCDDDEAETNDGCNAFHVNRVKVLPAELPTAMTPASPPNPPPPPPPLTITGWSFSGGPRPESSRTSLPARWRRECHS